MRREGSKTRKRSVSFLQRERGKEESIRFRKNSYDEFGVREEISKGLETSFRCLREVND